MCLISSIRLQIPAMGVNDVLLRIFSGCEKVGFSIKACASRLFSVCFSGRVPLYGKQAGASRTQGKAGMISHLSVPWRDNGAVLSEVERISLHWEPFNGAENLPSAPENPPWNSHFQQPVTTCLSRALFPLTFALFLDSPYPYHCINLPIDAIYVNMYCDADKYHNKSSQEMLRLLPHKEVYTHTQTHKGIEGWINASQASLASCCFSGKTGRARQEGETERGEVR